MWPEGKMLLVVDPNETGKTTLCEAISAALFGLPRGKVAGQKARDLRRPRSGAPFAVGLDVRFSGKRWTVDRDLEGGTLRVVDRDSGNDVTRDFLRPSGRDVVGERATGLTEPLFRTTAYVAQNVLDRDELDSTLTVELARIADSGGGEASVVRALRALQEVRAKMPGASTGASVSVETEILRLTRKADDARNECERLEAARNEASLAAARLARLTGEVAAETRKARLAELAVVERERRELAGLLARTRQDAETRRALEAEAEMLRAEAQRYASAAVQRADDLVRRRGELPQALAARRAALVSERGLAEREGRDRLARFGGLGSLNEEERGRLSALLLSVVESGGEAARAVEALESQREELRREGLADDLDRLDGISGPDREFVWGAEEERTSLELRGVQCDRHAAEAQAGAAILVGERRERLRLAMRFLAVSGFLLPVGLLLVASSYRPVGLGLSVFAACLALLGGGFFLKARGHGRDDEEKRRAEEAAARLEAQQLRKRLSDLRLRLDALSRRAGFPDTKALLTALRRARAAEAKRKALVEREARKAAVDERRAGLYRELAPFREILGPATGLPAIDEAQRLLSVLADLERALRAADSRLSGLTREDDQLASEEGALSALEAELRSALRVFDVPERLPLEEALLAYQGGKKRAARFREILEIELPARRSSVEESPAAEIETRLRALEEEIAGRLAELSAVPADVVPAETAEEARRRAEEARERVAAVELEKTHAERDLARKARGSEKAREAAELLAETEVLLARALLFRDALETAREALAAAASSAYGDFRRGLAEASRAILATWPVPYESLEFGEDLSVSVLLRGGRLVTRNEIAGALSTGAREQIHLTARLASLRYLGTGVRGVPLLLDDPLVGADDARFAAVMKFLATQVLEERPVLAVSCHAWRHERLGAVLPPEVRERIHPVTLRPFSSNEPAARLPGAAARLPGAAAGSPRGSAD
ncbi:MAG: hypothetical protein JNK60_19440 [Acidobacteria bacterium]|nr:hypothetical protein [Acidobacteriota bacterium]